MGRKEDEIQEAVDRGEYGRALQYDAAFLGPRAKRSCTDIICLLLFLAFIVAWIVVGCIAFSKGDPAKLIAPVDTSGNRCGVDPDVKDKSYLFYTDISKCNAIDCASPTFCVENCPTSLYIADRNNITQADIKVAVCSKTVSTTDQYIEALNSRECAEWYIPTNSVARRCIRVNANDISESNWRLINEKLGISKDDIVNGSKAVQVTSQAQELGQTIVNDMRDTWPWLLGAMVIAMLLCLIYIIIMRWFAWIIVWFSLIGVVALLAYCCYATWVNYQDVKNDAAQFDFSVDAVLALKETWLIFFILSCIFLVIVVIMIIFLRNRIRIAIALISEASRAVGSITSTLAFPILPWLLQLGVIAWAVGVGIYLASSTSPTFRVTGISDSTCSCKYKDNDVCEPEEFESSCSGCIDALCVFIKHEAKSYVGYLHAANFFGFFWLLFFMSAFGEMVLAGAFASWYWTFNKSDVPFFTLSYSLGRTLRYHIGTLAFGSLILAICRMIRVILEYIDSKLKKFDNFCVKCLMCCLKCFFWLLEKFIKFINRNAYIMCAIHGKNFCSSARKAFNLLMRNIIRVFVVDKVTDFILFLGKLLITGAMVALAFYIFGDEISGDKEFDVPEVNYYLMPVIIIGFATYFVASIFFGVYAMAVDTLFLCFLEDLERNDGSLEKPYYMSKKLMKILGKKNKKYKDA